MVPVVPHASHEAPLSGRRVGDVYVAGRQVDGKDGLCKQQAVVGATFSMPDRR